MITFVKTIHTFIWAIMASAVLYVVYCGLTDKRNLLLWVSIGLIIFEGIALLLNKWDCPITSIAKKYTHDRKDNFDICLPNFIAKYSKRVFILLFIIGMILIIF